MPTAQQCYDKWVARPTELLENFEDRKDNTGRPLLQEDYLKLPRPTTLSATELIKWTRCADARRLMLHRKITRVTRPKVSKTDSAAIQSTLSRVSSTEMEERDIAMWAGQTREATPVANIAKKLFTAIHLYGMFYKNRHGAWADYSEAPYGYCLASALSHGNRVMFMLPASTDRGLQGRVYGWNPDNKIYNAITNNQGIPGRIAATHGLTRLATAKALLKGHSQWFTEEKTRGGSNDGDHRAIDLSLGGTGNINSYSGVRISNNGAHGHLYANYCAPKMGHPGCLMIGVENSKSGKTGQSAKSHGVDGKGGEYSACGGKKWGKLLPGDFADSVAGADKATFIVDMTFDTTTQVIANLGTGWSEAWLTQAPHAVRSLNALRPGVAPAAVAVAMAARRGAMGYDDD